MKKKIVKRKTKRKTTNVLVAITQKAETEIFTFNEEKNAIAFIREISSMPGFAKRFSWSISKEVSCQN